MVSHSRGQLPLESLLLILLAGGLLVYPLLQAPAHDVALRQHRSVVPPEPFLSGVLKLKDLSAAMGGIEYHGPRYREGFAAVATVRIQPLPGWPTEDSPSLLQRKLELPAGWTAVLLIYEDFGIASYSLEPGAVQVHLSSADQPERVGRLARKQLLGHATAADSLRDLQLLGLPPLSFSGNNSPTSFQMPIVFKGPVDFAAMSRAELELGSLIERLTLEKPLPPAARVPGEGR